MALLVYPSAMRERISYSLSVRFEKGRPVLVRWSLSGVAKYCVRRCVIEGLKIASPLAAARMAAKIDLSSSNIVSIRMAISGFASRMRRVASMPVTLGMLRSINITSGRSSSASSIASSPSIASPTNSAPGSAPSMARIPRRKTGWSSATRTRMRSVGRSINPPRAKAAWQGREYPLGEGLHDEAAAQFARAFAHRCQADPGPDGGILPGTRYPEAVVADLHAQYPRFLHRQEDGAGPRPGVVRDVGECLLGYAVGCDLDRGRQRWQILWRLHRDVQALCGVLRSTLAQSAQEAEIVERRRPEPVDQAPDVGDGILGVRLQLEQQPLGGVRVAPHERADGVDRERLAGELGPQTIMQVAPETTTFFFTCLHKAFARALQVGGEPHRLISHERGVGRGADLVRQVLQKPSFPRPESLVPGP